MPRAQAVMRSVAPLALVVVAVAEAADERHVFGIPAVLNPGPQVAHSMAAPRTWVDARSYLAPVLVASYLAVELALRSLLEAHGPEPAAESLHEVDVPRESRRLVLLGLATLVVARAPENS